MQVKIEKSDLNRILQHALFAIDPRETMPCLSHVLLQAENNRLSIYTTNLEVSYLGSCQANIQEPGAVLLPAKHFHRLIKGFTSKVVEINNNKINGYDLNSLLIDNYPLIIKMPDSSSETIKCELIKEMIEKTIFSVSADDLQYHLSSIFWERVGIPRLDPAPDQPLEEGVEPELDYWLRLISTDGHRLTLIERPMPGIEHFFIENDILISQEGCRLILNILSRSDRARIVCDDKRLYIEKYEVRQGISLIRHDIRESIFIRLLTDKKFPDYRRIIPESFTYRFAINRRLLFDTIRRIALLSTERFKGMILKLMPDHLEVTFNNPEVGEGREVVGLLMEQGDAGGLPMEIGFNARYFLEPLNAIASDMVLLEVNSPNKVVKLSAPSDPHYLNFISTMNL